MKTLTDCYELSNGVKIPCIGFGTFKAEDGDEALDSILCALEVGYRHIDTAQGYRNENSVGSAIKKSGINREEIFVTTKLLTSEHGYEKTCAAFEGSLERLGLDYLDLYLVHWPNPISVRNRWQEALAGSWKAFEKYYNSGKIRSIGISNFHQHHIESLMKTASVAPMVNQIRLCPGDTQDELVEYCRERNMLLQAYCPFGHGQIFDVPEMKVFAEKYNKTIAQICVRWSLQRGYLPLPKSVNPERIKANVDVFDFEISDSDVQLIADLKGCAGYSTDPDTITW